MEYLQTVWKSLAVNFNGYKQKFPKTAHKLAQKSSVFSCSYMTSWAKGNWALPVMHCRCMSCIWSWPIIGVNFEGGKTRVTLQWLWQEDRENWQPRHVWADFIVFFGKIMAKVGEIYMTQLEILSLELVWMSRWQDECTNRQQNATPGQPIYFTGSVQVCSLYTLPNYTKSSRLLNYL